MRIVDNNNAAHMLSHLKTIQGVKLLSLAQTERTAPSAFEVAHAKPDCAIFQRRKREAKCA